MRNEQLSHFQNPQKYVYDPIFDSESSTKFAPGSADLVWILFICWSAPSGKLSQGFLRKKSATLLRILKIAVSFIFWSFKLSADTDSKSSDTKFST